MNNVTQFVQDAVASASPEYRRAWALQNEIEAQRKSLERKEDELRELINSLKNTNDEVFAVANLREYHHVDTQWVLANMPDEYKRLVSISDTKLGYAISSVYTREQVIDFVLEVNPELFDQLASISVADFRAEVGTKRFKQLCGTAVKSEFRAVKGTRIVIKHPERYALSAPVEEVN